MAHYTKKTQDKLEHRSSERLAIKLGMLFEDGERDHPNFQEITRILRSRMETEPSAFNDFYGVVAGYRIIKRKMHDCAKAEDYQGSIICRNLLQYYQENILN